MYIDEVLIRSYIQKIGVRGIFHVGASFCQELSMYEKFGIPANQIVWIEAIPDIVEKMKANGIQNMYQAVFAEVPGELSFNVTSNNGESSSILALKQHLNEHPEVQLSHNLTLQAQTMKHFVDTNQLPEGCLDFLVMDIQGAELHVLRGSPEVLKDVKMIVTEVSTAELYAGQGLFSEVTSFLETHGFECVQKFINRQNWGDAFYIRKEYL
jgi:FkbM family methyltransferase